MKRRAFTLLELLLVLALITAISALSVASYRRQYARAQFKSAVVALQIDLNRTRLLAMRTGEAYLFRYVPGTGVYEIAPLRTLQEVIYRANGELEEESNDALGGSLTSSPGVMEPTLYTDDLFSRENILADLAAAGRATARLGATSVDMTSPLGGALAAPSVENTAALGYGVDATLNPFATTSADALGAGGQFTLDGGLASSLNEGALTTTLRDMNVEERAIGKSENTLAWRVNQDGLIVRKTLAADAIFTFSRISLSTPTNLRSRRPSGASNTETPTPTAELATDVGDFGSRLGGSLTSPPSGSTSDALGGGLNAPAGFDASSDAFAATGAPASEEVAQSVWSEPILFYPNGRTSTAVVGLASIGKHQYYSEVAIRGMTGYARISGISAAPPGSDLNPSALTQEQLFRLSHPLEDGVAVSGVDASGAPTASNSPTAPNLVEPALEQGLEPLADPLTTQPDLLSDSTGFAPRYGSTTGRSGYRFDASGASTLPSSAAPPTSSPLVAEPTGTAAPPFDAVDQATSAFAPSNQSTLQPPSSATTAQPAEVEIVPAPTDATPQFSTPNLPDADAPDSTERGNRGRRQ